MTTVMLIVRAFIGVTTSLDLIGDRLSAVIPVGPFLDLMDQVGATII